LDLLHCVHRKQQVRNAGNHRRATLTSVDVRIKCTAFLARHHPVKVIAEPRFGLFASPSHLKKSCHSLPVLPSYDGLTPICCKILANSMRPRLILDFTVPSGTASTC